MNIPTDSGYQNLLRWFQFCGNKYLNANRKDLSEIFIQNFDVFSKKFLKLQDLTKNLRITFIATTKDCFEFDELSR